MEQVKDTVKIGTRGSPLALAQAREVRRSLAKADGRSEEAFEIIIIKTAGDKFLDTSLRNIGGKGLFTKEIEEALLKGEIDLAVHSAKDMQTTLAPGLSLAAFLTREDRRDVFISEKHTRFADLPEGAVLGTASIRRAAQLLRLRPDLKTTLLRGNVQTRLRKLKEENFDATLLSYAGLKRLNMTDIAKEILSLDDFPTAPAQGAICIEIFENVSEYVKDLVRALNCRETERCVTAERAFLAALDGSCKTPIAARTRLENDRLYLQGFLYSPDGVTAFEERGDDVCDNAFSLGYEVGNQLRSRIPTALKKILYG